jgi:hypothetical protein
VYVRTGAWLCPFGQTVMWSDVDAKTIAARMLTSER